MLIVTEKKHNVRTILIVIAIISFIVAGATWWYLSINNRNTTESINNYNQCVAAGYAILETYPEQCKTSDGRTFVRDISSEVRPIENTVTKKNEYTSTKGVKIIVDTPANNTLVAIPFVVSGQVPGNWSFEASFPVEMIDKDGNLLNKTPAQLTGDWMTDKLVPFSVTISSVKKTYSGAIKLILRKDNPSGLVENDDSVVINLTLE